MRRRSTIFLQECPTCGRKLEIKVEYLGRQLACQHCRGTFVARDPASFSAGQLTPDVAEALAQRVEDLISFTTRS